MYVCMYVCMYVWHVYALNVLCVIHKYLCKYTLSNTHLCVFYYIHIYIHIHTDVYYYIVFVHLMCMYNILYTTYAHMLLGQLDVSHRGLPNTYHRRHCIGQCIV